VIAIRIVSWLALAGTIVPALLFVNDQITLGHMQLGMLVATIAWFATAPAWMERTGKE
jgi:hypothetical protein